MTTSPHNTKNGRDGRTDSLASSVSASPAQPDLRVGRHPCLLPGTHEVFYDKLTFLYLSMPKFNKAEDQLESRFDKWLYALKFLCDLR